MSPPTPMPDAAESRVLRSILPLLSDRGDGALFFTAPALAKVQAVIELAARVDDVALGESALLDLTRLMLALEARAEPAGPQLRDAIEDCQPALARFAEMQSRRRLSALDHLARLSGEDPRARFRAPVHR